MNKDPSLLQGIPFWAQTNGSNVELLGEPRFIGRGSSQVAYEVPGLDKLIKVDYATLADPDINGDIMRQTFPVLNTSPNVVAHVVTMYGIRDIFRKIHGPQRMLDEHYAFMPFRVTGRVYRELWGASPYADDQGRWFNTFVTFQTKSKPLLEPDKYETVPIDIKPVERLDDTDPPIDMLDYEEACERWVNNKGSRPWKDEDWELLAQVNGEQVLTIRDRCQDPGFVSAFRLLIANCLKFSKETHLHTDMADDNVYLRKKDGQWDYEVMDGIAPYPEAGLSIANRGLREILAGNLNSLGWQQVRWLYNTVGYIRFVNAMSQALGLDESGYFLSTSNLKWSSLYDECRAFKLNAQRPMRLRGPLRWKSGVYQDIFTP